MLKQEGEMALAAKRRRLSQADSHMTTGETFGMQTTKITHIPSVDDLESDSPSPPKTASSRKRTLSQDGTADFEESLPRPQKIWSPSGGKMVICCTN